MQMIGKGAPNCFGHSKLSVLRILDTPNLSRNETWPYATSIRTWTQTCHREIRNPQKRKYKHRDPVQRAPCVRYNLDQGIKTKRETYRHFFLSVYSSVNIVEQYGQGNCPCLTGHLG